MVDKETQVIKEYEGIVKSICVKYPKDMFDDLYQVGCIALLKAHRNYNPDKGTSFRTHAFNWIKGYINHYYRDKASLIRIPRPVYEKGMRKIEIQDIANNIPSYKVVDDEDMKVQFAMILDFISERVPAMEYRVFKDYYKHSETQDAIAEKYNYTQMRVCRILKKCIGIIKEAYGVN